MNIDGKDAAMETIEAKLRAALRPAALRVINNSHLHAGHAGSPNNGRSHFRVEIQAEELNGMKRVAAHQRVYEVLADEMADHIHALEIILLK